MGKTAMNQMLEELIANEWEIPMTLIAKAKELVQVEKEQIIKAYKKESAYMKHAGCTDKQINESAKKYYNETYGRPVNDSENNQSI